MTRAVVVVLLGTETSKEPLLVTPAAKVIE